MPTGYALRQSVRLERGSGSDQLVDGSTGARSALSPAEAVVLSLVDRASSAADLARLTAEAGKPVPGDEIRRIVTVFLSRGLVVKVDRPEPVPAPVPVSSSSSISIVLPEEERTAPVRIPDQLRAPAPPTPVGPMPAFELDALTPTLASRLQIRPKPGFKGVFQVEDPLTGKKFDLYDLEVTIARLLNGKRTGSDVLAAINRLGVPATLDTLRKFVKQLYAYGFLDVSPPLQSSASSAGANWPAREPWDENTRAFFHSGVTKLRENKFGEAKQYFEAMLETNPNNREALEMLALVEQRLSSDLSVVDRQQGMQVVEAENDENAEVDAAPPEPDAQPISTQADVIEELQVSTRKRRLGRVLIAALILAAMAIPIPFNVTMPCSVQPAGKGAVRSPGDGWIAEVLVGEGELVNEGQELVRLDDSGFRSVLQRKEAELNQVQLEIDRLKSGPRPEEIARVQAVLDGRYRALALASKNLKRVRQVFDKQLASRDEMTAAEQQVSEVQSAVSTAKAELQLVRAGAPPEEISKRTAELKTKILERDQAKAALASAHLMAPIPGLITTPRLKEKAGIHVTLGELVVEVENVDRMRAIGVAREVDLAHLSLGAPTLVKVSNLPDREFEGKITFLSPIIETDPTTGERTVRVETEIENPDHAIKPNVSGYVKVRQGSRPLISALLSPIIRWLRLRFFL